MIIVPFIQVFSSMKSLAVKNATTVLILSFFIFSATTHGADFPKAKLSNGHIRVRMYLPDPDLGYYRSTRFDWSGAIYSLEYKGHNYYGQWYARVDKNVINWVHKGAEIVSGPCSALFGPVDEFQTPLGFNEAKPGETFIKIGVGSLRKVEGNYNRYMPYEVIDPGKWSVKKGKNKIEFIQELSDPKTGFAYEYHKVITLANDKPVMVIGHFLKNTGQKVIKSSVYNHNFVVIDKQGPGPDYTFKVPYQITVAKPPDKELAEIRGNQVVYMKPLTGEDEVAVQLDGFTENLKDTEVIIENTKMGAGMRLTGDRPLIRSILWSVRSVLAVEPYIAIEIQPGEEFTWENKFEYYVVP
jgi:hypothetical protein